MSDWIGTGTAAVTPSTPETDDIFINALRDLLDSPLGYDAIYTPTAGVPVSIRCFYNKDGAPELGIEGYRVWIEALASEVSAAKPGESVTVLGTTYKIKDPPVKGDDGLSVIELTLD
jgi:hypothetical protein